MRYSIGRRRGAAMLAIGAAAVAVAAKRPDAVLIAPTDSKAIFAANLFSAEGAASGLRQAGKLGQVKIVGFDASITKSNFSRNQQYAYTSSC
jgi:DNA-binding LacI/PurR family transcriptional regulator